MPGPDPDFPNKWTNFFDMIDDIRGYTSITSKSVIRFDYPVQTIGFLCEANGLKWYCDIEDVANTLQQGPDPDRAQLVTGWLQVDGAPDLMSYVNYFG
jgi:hypothetical protein